MHCAKARTFLFSLLILLAGIPAIAQRGHVLKIVTADSAGIYLSSGGTLLNKLPQREVTLDGLRRSTVDTEVAPAADQTASIRTRITLGDSLAARTNRFYAMVYELVALEDGAYELRIVSREPLFRPRYSKSGNMRVLEGHSEDPPPPAAARKANQLP